MTDTRTNEPTESQVERAKRAFYAHFWMPSDAGYEDDREDHEKLDEAMRAALVAAQGVAPQSESAGCGKTIHGAPCGATKPGHGLHFVNNAAPVLPSSTVDEDALAKLIEAHSGEALTKEGHKLDQDKVCTECGWAIRVAAENTSPIGQARRKYGHIARAVAEWLKGAQQ